MYFEGISGFHRLNRLDFKSNPYSNPDFNSKPQEIFHCSRGRESKLGFDLRSGSDLYDIYKANFVSKIVIFYNVLY